MNLKWRYDFHCACLLAFVTGIFGMTYIYQKVDQNGFEVLRNFTTVTMTECAYLCDQTDKCHSILDWNKEKCVLLTDKKKDENNLDGIQENNQITVMTKIQDNIAFQKDLSAPTTTCCFWGKFSPCNATCDGGARVRSRTCYTGGVKRDETDIQRCNEQKCSTEQKRLQCIWKESNLSGDILTSYKLEGGLAECQKKCQRYDGCDIWIWKTGKNLHKNCYLKELKRRKDVENRESNPSYTIGLKHCKSFPE